VANTITLKNQLVSPHKAIVYLTLASDGSQETDTTVYDSSVVATALGIPDPKISKIMSIRWSSNSALGICKLNWDASTKVLAWALPFAGRQGNAKFYHFGGLLNTGGAGITGDINITTTGLASGDALSLILEVRLN
jgi:hypothetical protein